jgi:predicted RND superfamily exporter protein
LYPFSENHLKEESRLPSKITKFLTRHPALILTIAVLLLIPSAFGYINTRINYDILSYLPKTLDSTKGEDVLENTFHDAATSLIVIDNMQPKDVTALKEKIKKVSGVNNAVWVDDIADTRIPKQMLPDLLKDTFYSKNSTLLVVTYKGAASSDDTLAALTGVRKLLNQNCFLSGLSAVTKDTGTIVNQQIPYYMLFAFLFSVTAMMLCMRSWVQPFVFMLGFLFPLAYNFGTNILMGQISYITQAIAAVLQLGVTMDFSIFLLNRYDEEKPRFEDRRDAMAKAISEAFVAIVSSSSATVAGFAALCFMDLTLGRDIGVVMMKGRHFRRALHADDPPVADPRV